MDYVHKEIRRSLFGLMLYAAVEVRIRVYVGKEEVLLALIENPSFCNAAEQAILEQLDRLAFESNKKKILEAISKRKA